MTTDHPPVAHHVSLPRPGLAHAAAVGVGAAGADVLVHGLQRRLPHNCLLLELVKKVREDFTIAEKAPTRAFSWLKAAR